MAVLSELWQASAPVSSVKTQSLHSRRKKVECELSCVLLTTLCLSLKRKTLARNHGDIHYANVKLNHMKMPFSHVKMASHQQCCMA